jgi:hypothetical protein
MPPVTKFSFIIEAAASRAASSLYSDMTANMSSSVWLRIIGQWAAMTTGKMRVRSRGERFLLIVTQLRSATDGKL